HAAALAGELTRLQQDLVGDGWTVIRQDVARTATAPQVKQLIQNAYNADPANVKSVFLFGHVAVPYSGNYNPDGHPDHKGAWTADTYYGDMDGTWTDSSVNNSGAEKAWNHNTPGDGKFDQSDLPSDVELAIGRVDLYNMTCYSNKAWSRTELDLLRAYLNKDHNFRHGRMVVPRRGLVCDNFGEMGGEAFASTGWRSFASFFGAQNNVQVPYGQYFSTLRDNGYLWSYGTGGGSWYTCNGIGGSDDFANTEIKTVFTAFLGSYFGDWDNESAFLRAPLGSGWALASVWGGRPHWFFHPMGLGETIGTATKLSQNNRYGGLYSRQNWGTRQVHVTLLGDPSLRMHPVIPPASVAVNGGTVTWAASTDSAIQGYNVYRAPSVNGPFTKVNGTSLVTSLFFTDAAPVSGSVYMVRAVKLEQSGSGTYLNLSQGILSAGSAVSNPTPTPTPVAPKPPTSLSGSALSSSEVRIQWTDNSSDESGFRILRKAGVSGAYTTIAVGANTVAYTDSSLSAGTQYFYKVHAYNAVGNSAESAEINVSTSAAPATPPSTSGATSAVFLQSDTATRGAWKGFYGAEGAVAPSRFSNLPGSVQLTQGNKSWVWANPSTHTGALQSNVDASRAATCWYGANSMNFTFNFNDGLVHRVSLYFFDFENSGRKQKVEVYNSATGELLTVNTIENFQNGLYLNWNLKGAVRIRIVCLAGANAVVSGIFFDPTTTSAPPPGTSTAAANAVRYLGANTTTSGSWKSAFGIQGYQIAGDSAKAPTYANVTFSGKSDHVWNWSTADSAALQKGAATDRVASCWYASGSFDVRVNVTDGQTHKVGFYVLDWDAAGRSQRVDVLDATTGAVLHTTNLSGFQRGAYANYDVKGSVIFRFTKTAGANAVVSGIFFDPPSAPL
ncbi:MAG: fibronectin type III domain-containing protein, partial [Limisphaerales bacterium]